MGETEKVYFKKKDNLLYMITKNNKFFNTFRFKPSKKEIESFFDKGKVENVELYSEKKDKTFNADILVEWKEFSNEKGKAMISNFKIDLSKLQTKAKESPKDGEIVEYDKMWKMRRDGKDYILMKNNKFIENSKLLLGKKDIEILFMGKTLEKVSLYSSKKNKNYTADLKLDFKPIEGKDNVYFANFSFANNFEKGIN